jgi:integrase/recombinase XerD
MTFAEYLGQKRLSPATIETYLRYTNIFTGWLETEALSGACFTYTDLLDFMQQLKKEGRSNHALRQLLCIIRHYCAYLIREGKRSDNPACGVYVRGQVRTLPTNLLSMDELQQLYQLYAVQLSVDRGKKIMLGLMIYQGVTVAELARIEARHIHLEAGKIRIKATRRSGERILPLDGVQVVELQHYLKSKGHKEGPLLAESRKQVLSERNVQNRVRHMLKHLQQLNPRVTSADQIRSSVITYWLKSNNLRQVQYMAGHKYISSTERYKLTELEDLQSELKRHHPMQ